MITIMMVRMIIDGRQFMNPQTHFGIMPDEAKSNATTM